MNQPHTLAASRLHIGAAIPGGTDLGLQPRYATNASVLESLLNQSIAAAVAGAANVVVVGLTCSGGGDPTMWIGMLSFGQDATPDAPVAIAGGSARVFCEEAAGSDQALAEAASRIWNRMAALNAASVVYQVQVGAGGSGPKYLISVLASVPPT